MPRPPKISIPQRVEKEIVHHSHKISRNEALQLIEAISLHWGNDGQTWIPQLGQPLGEPIHWKRGILVELFHLSSKMSTESEKKMALEAIRKEVQKRSNGKGNSADSITPSDVMTVRAKADFIHDISQYWTSDCTKWLPSGRQDLSSAFEMSIELLCGLALLSQTSSLGSIDRMLKAKALLDEQVEQRLREEAVVREIDAFKVLQLFKVNLFNGQETGASFYERLPHRRSVTQNTMQSILENAAHCRGSAYGTPEWGATVMNLTNAQQGASLRVSEGAFWKISPANSMLVPLHTDSKTVRNVKLIQQLEIRFGEPLAVILKSPALRAREALAMPTELLQKMLFLCEQFGLRLSKFQSLVQKKLLEKQAEINLLTDTHFRSISASDIEEVIQETRQGGLSPSSDLESLFEEPLEATSREEHDSQVQADGPPQKRQRLSYGGHDSKEVSEEGFKADKLANSKPSKDNMTTCDDDHAHGSAVLASGGSGAELGETDKIPAKALKHIIDAEVQPKPREEAERQKAKMPQGNVEEVDEDQSVRQQQKTVASPEAVVHDLQRLLEHERVKRQEAEARVRDLEAQLQSYQQRDG
ncbi:hypothetical protein HDK90DRAFT_547379 [Phyllosticta capitalensis]|uniref:Uncharacterized protein n=1 Tax=Phyllosticta capitalensis TaxID=121624 RepID=A0ABR1Z0S3_9PEZI